MDQWSNNQLMSSFVPSSTPHSFLCPYDFDRFHQDQLKQAMTMAETQQASLHLPLANEEIIPCGYGSNKDKGGQEKKKKMTSEQLKMLERSFQEEIKLDAGRKMKLSEQLGLQPRQISVWFQNKKARWKNKQLEHLYKTLRQQFDAVSREKQMLQEEVMKLKSLLRQTSLSSKQMWNAYGEETTDEKTTVGGTIATGFDSAPPQYTPTNREVLDVEDHNFCPTASPNGRFFVHRN